MSKAVEFNIKGIKCDNPKCDYKNDNVVVKEYNQWLNKPCPKCGANILTQEDYDNVMMLMSFTDFVNDILPERKDDEKIFEMPVIMNGTGEIKLGEVKEKE